MNSTIDPEYYRGDTDETGQDHEASGYWIKSPLFEIEARRRFETRQAVDKGRACWLPANDDDIPF